MSILSIFFLSLAVLNNLQGALVPLEDFLEQFPLEINQNIFARALKNVERDYYFEDYKKTIGTLRILCSTSKNIFSNVPFKDCMLKKILLPYSVKEPWIPWRETQQELNIQNYKGKLDENKVSNKSLFSWFSLNEDELGISTTPYDILGYIYKLNTKDYIYKLNTKKDQNTEIIYLRDDISISNLDFIFLVQHYSEIITEKKNTQKNHVAFQDEDYSFKENFCRFIGELLLHYFVNKKTEVLIGDSAAVYSFFKIHCAEEVTRKIVKDLINRIIQRYRDICFVKKCESILQFYPEGYGKMRGDIIMNNMKKSQKATSTGLHVISRYRPVYNYQDNYFQGYYTDFKSKYGL